MILDENEEPCSAKTLANEILMRCLANIGSYLAENVPTLDQLTEKERQALNVQLIKQATRCFRLLGVHPDDIGQRFDADEKWNPNMTDKEDYLVDKDGVRISENNDNEQNTDDLHP